MGTHTRLLALLMLLAASPTAAQEIYGIRPGMDFAAAEAKLKETSELQSRSSSEGIYRSSFQGKQGLITIAASKEAFESRSEARVQWISLTVSAGTTANADPSKACARYRERWRRKLGNFRRDSLSGGTLLRWKRPSLQARILCHREARRTEVVLLSEPILLSGRTEADS